MKIIKYVRRIGKLSLKRENYWYRDRQTLFMVRKKKILLAVGSAGPDCFQVK